MSPPLQLPAGVLAMADRGPAWAAWVDRLPRLAQEVVEEWQLVGEGHVWHGHASLVLPVRTGAGRPVVLKLGYPDDESEHEHLALQHWRGRGAVQLVRADPRRRALLLERLHEPLTGLEAVEACEVVAGLYADLHRPALPQLRPLTAYLERWDAGLARLPRAAPLPARLVQQALSLGRDLGADPASTGRVVHADLHDGNVLAGDRAPWLVIDPKPVNGDPHYEPAPLLWNRWAEVLGSGSVRQAVRRRFHAVLDAAGLEEDRARDWVVVRSMHNATWTLAEAEGRALTGAEQDHVTRMVTVAKAVQD